MKRLGSLMLVAVLAMAVPAANAAERKSSKSKKAPPVETPAVAQVTHCELAQLLVQVLGLARFLQAAPTCQQCFAMLMDNAVVPAEGWDGTKIVTKADLARVIVQSLKKQGDIKNPDDPKEWIDYLRSVGIPIDSVGEAVAHVGPLPDPVATHIASARVDPLVRRHQFNPTDETQYGVDMQSITRLLSQLEFSEGEFRPLTPD